MMSGKILGFCYHGNHFHGDQNTKYALPSLGMTWDSDPTLLTRAPREGQGPSIILYQIYVIVVAIIV